MSKLDNPSAAAQQWASRLGQATQAYTDGVNSVTVAPGQLAAAAGDRWMNNTAAALPRFKANSAAVSREQWQQAAISKGAPRLASGATAAQPKVEQVFAKLFPAIRNVVSSLPARGDINQNVERSRQFALKLNSMKGSFK
jgi:predicted transcriptional regulator